MASPELGNWLETLEMSESLVNEERFKDIEETLVAIETTMDKLNLLVLDLSSLVERAKEG